MSNIGLIIAGGSGTRMKQQIPKQFLTVNEKPVIIYTLEAFEKHPEIDVIAVVCLEGWDNILQAYARQFGISKLQYIIPGGETGQASVENGLFELEKHYSQGDLVLIHDANRPMISEEIISDCIATTKQYGCAVAAIPCADTMMETVDGAMSAGVYPREQLRRTQRPHGFFLGKICQVHRQALEKGIANSSACCTIMAEMGEQVRFFPGSEKNLKLTTMEDIDIFKALLAAKRAE